MPKGNIHDGLLRDIIDVMNELGPDRCYHRDEIAAALKERGRWPDGQAQTPEQTVGTYFTQNLKVFEPAYGAEYSLRKEYHRQPEPQPEQSAVDAISSLVFAAVWRERRQAQGESGTKANAMLRGRIAAVFEAITGRGPSDHELGRMLMPPE